MPHAWQAAWSRSASSRCSRPLAIARADAASGGTAARQRRRASPFRWAPFAPGLAGYFLFGLGYIGYMTFVITLLREQQMGAAAITAFYVVLGVGVIASSWLWAGLLQRSRGGGAFALLNALLAVATALPVISAHPLAVFASGALFGGVFLSVVASTTALVRHNLPPAAWAGGIARLHDRLCRRADRRPEPRRLGRRRRRRPGARVRRARPPCSPLGSLIAWRQKPLVVAA